MIWPGIGQIYSGNALRGWIFIISQILFSCLGGWLILSSTGDSLIGLILLLTTVLVGIVSLFDAHRCAKKANTVSLKN